MRMSNANPQSEIKNPKSLRLRLASTAHHFLALGALGGDEFPAALVAGLFEMLVLAELLGQTFLLARLLEAAQKLFHVFTGTTFDTNHGYDPLAIDSRRQTAQ